MTSEAPFRAFIDESLATRGEGLQEYLIGSAVIPADKCATMRGALRPLLLPGQIKLHWTDESRARKNAIVDRLCELEPMTVVVTHLSERQRKTERFRRKCLETLYQELLDMKVHDLTLESRSRNQDTKDVAHIVALQGQGLGRDIRISHLRGGDEPLLWIADAVLGAINAAHLGEVKYLDALSSTFVLQRLTADSLLPSESERP